MTETYIAEHLWLVTDALYASLGGKLKTTRYTEFINPALKNNDNRTAQEIIEDIKEKLSRKEVE